MLLTENITKSYNNLCILNNASLSIQKGEIVSIVGASGAGKSTLLHILGTLEKPDSGKLFLNNQDMLALKGKQLAAFRNKHIGFVFQFHHLLPEFSALENMIMPALITGENQSNAKQKALKLLDRLNLSNRASHKPNAMSGGEQQRVAIGRALINNPDIILADEPTGNLDTQNAMAIFNLLLELRDEINQTFVVVTHNDSLVKKTDRIIHMKDGKTT
ncbi:MAG: ABC transporter ATP-binding protein [Chitinophagaceae bacterium]